MPDGYFVDEAESVDTIPAAAVCARQSAAQLATLDGEKQAVRA
jgi:hypothetical protein